MSNVQFWDRWEILAFFRAIWRNEIQQFEREFAQYVGCKYAVATSYGRTALYLALRTIPVVGREVMVPAFTCPVVRDAIALAGAKPTFIDVDTTNLDMVMADIQRKRTEKTTAIIPTHYYGDMCSNMERIQVFSKQYNITVVEDCAHSLGAEYKGRKAGSFGDISVFSLTKNTLNLAGGVLVTNNESVYEKARLILGESEEGTVLQRWKDFCSTLHYGYLMAVDKLVFDRIGKSFLKWWFRKMPHIIHDLILPGLRFLEKHTPTKRNRVVFHGVAREDVGHRQPLSNLAMYRMIASVARVQLQKIDGLNERRRVIAQNLQERLPSRYLAFWNQNTKVRNVYSALPLWCAGRDIDKLKRKCGWKGVRLRRSWPTSPMWWREQDTKNMERLRDNVLLFAISPMLSDQEIDQAGEMIEEALEESYG